MTTLAYSRQIAVQGAYNLRDIGGYKTAGGASTRWRSHLRADSLHGLTQDDMELLAAQGLRLVIDLRGDQEIAEQPNPFASHSGIRYVNVPIFAALAPIAMMRSKASRFRMAEHYRDAIDQCGPAISRVIGLIAEEEAGSVLFHCTAGKDRTGVIAALLLLVAGVDRDTIIEDYSLTGTLAPGLIDYLRGRAQARGMEGETLEEMLASQPQTMATLLDHIETRYRGVESYLASIGIGVAHLARLRQRLLTA